MSLTPVFLGKTVENITANQIYEICRNIKNRFIQIRTSEENEYYKLFFENSDNKRENDIDIVENFLSIKGDNLLVLRLSKDINVEKEYPDVIEYFNSFERFKLFFNDIGNINSKFSILTNYRIFSEVSNINNKFNLQTSYYNYLEERNLSVLICVDIIRQLYNQTEKDDPFEIKEKYFSLFKSLINTNYEISDFLNSKRYNSTEKKNFGSLINMTTKKVKILDNMIIQTNNIKPYQQFEEFHFLETLNYLFEKLKEK